MVVTCIAVSAGMTGVERKCGRNSRTDCPPFRLTPANTHPVADSQPETFGG